MAVITPLLIGILVLLSVIGVLVLGGVVVLVVETARRGARALLEARPGSVRGPSAPRPPVEGAAAAPFAVDLRRQVRAVQDLLERADTAGTPVGELRPQVAELDHHAERIGAQSAGFDGSRAREEDQAFPDQLRRRADVVATALGHVRSYLAQEESDRSSAELADIVGRVRMETRVLRAVRDEDPLTEIARSGGPETGPERE
ncbi:hypothetical protein ACFXKD_26505 [Nocardiopsis aegyptia]|uniref:hypothetical protein n=1 Tax=Nocardiopsis aegyptia TaxID=220378 RepID=UPI00366D7A54